MITNLKNAKYLDVIFNSISDMVFLVSVGKDQSYRYVTVNQQVMDLLKFPEDYNGKRIEEIMPESSAEKIIGKYKEAIQKQVTISYETPLDFPLDGNKAEVRQGWVESNVTPIFNEEGHCEHVIAITREVTNRKNRERELRRTKEELEKVFNHVADAVFMFDENGDYLAVNPAFTTMFGWTRDDVFYNPEATIIPENQKAELDKLFRRLKQGEVIEAHRSQRKTKDGSVIEVLSSYSPIMEDGTMIGGVAVYKDVAKITELKDQLKESENRYQMIVEHSNDMIRVVNRDGYIQYASPAHQDILGIHPDFFAGKSYLSFIHLEDMAKVQNAFSMIIENKESIKFEYRRLNKDGEYVWVDTHGGPVLSASGEVEQVVFISRDISNQKEKEKELMNMALFDELTGLPNRTFFQHQVEIAMNTTKRKGTVAAILMLDSDNFKVINDKYGHDAGDKVIKEVARRVQNSVRDTDTVSRMGGDEFQVVLPDLEDKEDAIRVSERIRKEMKQPFEVSASGDTITSTVSIGISYYQGEGKSYEKLLKEADNALYQSKESGRNQWAVYHA
ncbi:diguanylate cyclase [Virgibacillus sp. MSP4-1]|uniref:sensor domain-containing protein n=1 Tax=Virgibacillus sp. MSP4-1 TaxID=2700081 RepID=UPI0003AA71C4|nr:diguanylate cyclase [Virgibacillus sp. MSP4-1]QHS21925.1 diguanylate cyclase [Virgibacillus sp. MSP4-1]